MALVLAGWSAGRPWMGFLQPLALVACAGVCVPPHHNTESPSLPPSACLPACLPARPPACLPARSGYATSEDGEPYWLVKNIWSPFWVGGWGSGRDAHAALMLHLCPTGGRQQGQVSEPCLRLVAASCRRLSAAGHCLPAPCPCLCSQGEKGYLRVTREPNDCGVSSEPVYLDLKPTSPRRPH